MMGKRRSAMILAIFLLGTPSATSAWSTETRVRMIGQILELMPTSLESVLKREHNQCIQGSLADGNGPEAEAGHRSRTAEELEQRLEQAAEAVEETIGAINRHESFGKIGFRFGQVAHWVADLNFPPNLPEGTGIPGPAFQRYRTYVENWMKRFQVVLDPVEPALLVRGDLDEYLRASGLRSSRYGSFLEEVFRLEAENPDPSRFDDRSVAFGIASLSYSRSISDISRVWLYIWDRAGGDMEGTPFPLPEAIALPSSTAQNPTPSEEKP